MSGFRRRWDGPQYSVHLTVADPDHGVGGERPGALPRRRAGIEQQDLADAGDHGDVGVPEHDQARFRETPHQTPFAAGPRTGVVEQHGGPAVEVELDDLTGAP